MSVGESSQQQATHDETSVVVPRRVPVRLHILKTLVHVLAALALCSLLGRWLWIGNLACNLSAHLIVLSMLCMLFCKRHHLHSGVLTITLGCFAVPWVQVAYQERLLVPVSGASTASLHCMLVNTAWWNTQHAAAAQDIIAEDADIVVLIEAHPTLVTELRQTKKWRYHYGRSFEGPRSQVVLSRVRLDNRAQHPVTRTQQQQASVEMGVQTLFEWTVDIPLTQQQQDANRTRRKNANKQTSKHIPQRVRFIVAHPPPTMLPRFRHIRKKIYQRIHELIERSAEPCILLGDLNATVASHEWNDVAALGMRRAAGWHQRTWGFGDAAMRHWGLGIDYIVGTAAVQMHPLRYSRVRGTDHIAVHAEIALPLRVSIKK